MWAELEKAARPATSPVTPARVQTKTVEQIVREAEGPNLDQIHVAPDALPAAGQSDGTLDYAAIYQAAKLPTVPYPAEQALDMLASMPSDLPLESKRQMMKAALNTMGKAIGATPENIVADASRKLAALAAYADNQTRLTTEYAATAEKKIAALQAQIEETRKSVQSAQQKATREAQLCAAETDRLDDILEFFSLDVPPSKYAAPDPPKA